MDYTDAVGPTIANQTEKHAIVVDQVKDGIDRISEMVKSFLAIAPSDHLKTTLESLEYWKPDAVYCWRELFYKLVALRNALETDCKSHYMYLYPRDKGEALVQWRQGWSEVISTFPDIEVDIYCAIDLFCLSHATASVYHSMRVLERGLVKICGHLCINHDGRNWYNIINDIERKIKEMQNSLSKGEREKALNYYSTVAKEFSYFKDGWRNYASHARCAYDEFQAQSVLLHVQTFMTYLATGFPDESLQKAIC